MDGSESHCLDVTRHCEAGPGWRIWQGSMTLKTQQSRLVFACRKVRSWPIWREWPLVNF
jgi:hypothetical protein